MGRKRNPITGLSCVYKMENIITGRCYVGATIDLRGRVATHFNTMERGVHRNPQIQEDHDIYGDVFRITILQKCDEKDLAKYEEKYMTELDTLNNGYNILSVSRAWCPESMRAKMSAAKIGAKNPRYGKPRSEATKKKISESLKKYRAAMAA